MNTEMLYTAIGDSLTAGYGAPTHGSFVEQYRRLAEHALKYNITAYNHGVNGATIKQLTDMIQNSEHIRNHLSQSQLVTITIGGNDLLQAGSEYLIHRNTSRLKQAFRNIEKDLDTLISHVKQFHSDQSFIVRFIELYNPLTQYEETRTWIHKYNSLLRRYEDQNTKVVPIYDQFAKDIENVLYEDHVHPNEKGYRIMAEEAHRLGYLPLS